MDDVSGTATASFRLGRALCLYHRHTVVGLGNLRPVLRRGGRVLLVGNHSMDVADPLMLRAALHRATGRLLRFVGHEMIFFRLPGMGSVMGAAGVVPSRRMDVAESALRKHRLLMIYPGAGGEASLRSYRREPYRLKWYGRLGFVELALRTRASVFFVAGLGLDEMFYQTDLRVPDRLFDLFRGTYLDAYRGLRLQMGMAGPHILPGFFPLPVRVTHVVSPRLRIGGVDPDDRMAVERLQVRLWAECQELLDQAVAERGSRSDLLDRAVRGGERWLERIGV